MTQVASIDFASKRILLHSDTATNGFDIYIAYDEVRQLYVDNVNDEQNYKFFISKEGLVSKGGGKFTPRYGFLDFSWRIIPYGGVSHALDILVEIVSADEISDVDVFDRSTLAVEVDIDSTYTQNEVITIAGGTGLDAGQDTKLTRIFNLLDVIENGMDHAQIMRILLAGMAGKVSGSGTNTITFKDASDIKDRIVATVDGDGNRTAITLDAS